MATSCPTTAELDLAAGSDARIFYYDNRYWEVSGYQIRGRVKGEDVIIGITGIETFPTDDMILDEIPGSA